MYDSPDFNNKFFRVYAIETDKYGIDPLLDRVVPRLMKINSYSNHEVTQDERGAPDLISLREYSSEDYWWHILAYNGICSYKDIVQGLTIKIPNLGDIIAITNEVITQSSGSSANIVTI